MVSDLHQLTGAHAAEGPRVEQHHYVLTPAKVSQRDGLTVLVAKCEVRCRLTDVEGHRQRRPLRAAFGDTSFVATQSGPAARLVVVESPAVGADSETSLGST